MHTMNPPDMAKATTKTARSGVSLLYDAKASLGDQVAAAERLLSKRSTPGDDSRSTATPYDDLRRAHHVREVLDWLLSPRGLAKLYGKTRKCDAGTSGSSFDLFARMWGLVREVLVGGAASGDTSVAVLASLSPTRTLPVVVARMASGMDMFLHEGEFPYSVLSDVLEVLGAGFRARLFAVQGDRALELFRGAGRVMRGLSRGVCECERDRERLRFAALVGELCVLLMKGGGRLEATSKAKAEVAVEVVGGFSFGAFFEADEASRDGRALRTSCREILRRVLFAEVSGGDKDASNVTDATNGTDTAAKKKVLDSLTSWTTIDTDRSDGGRMVGVHPRLVPWMVEAYPSGPSSAHGPTVSELFFGFADAYMTRTNTDVRWAEDIIGLSSLLESLKVRGADVYRSAGEEGQAMFARLKAVSDFLMAGTSVSHTLPHTLLAVVRGIDCILTVEHRGIEADLAGYWALLAALYRNGGNGMDAMCRSLNATLVEYNKLRRLDVLFESVDFRSGDASPQCRCWDAVVGSPTAMSSVRRALGRIPAGQSSRLLGLVRAWFVLLQDDSVSAGAARRAVSGLSCAVLESVPVDLNNAGNVAKSIRGMLEDNNEAPMLDSALEVVTKALAVHGRCCRIDPNIVPVPHEVPAAALDGLLARLQPMDGATTRVLVSSIVYHLQVECEALSAAQTRVGEGGGAGGAAAGDDKVQGQGRDQDETPRKRRRKDNISKNTTSKATTKNHDDDDDDAVDDAVARLMAMLGKALATVDGQGPTPPWDMTDLVDTDAWWFDIAMGQLGASDAPDAPDGSKGTALRRLLLSRSGPVRAGRAFCMRHVSTVINMAPKREAGESVGPFSEFAEHVDPRDVRHHYELLAPSVGELPHPGDYDNDVTIMPKVYELCVAHCAHALASSPRDDAHVRRVVRDLARHAEQTRSTEFLTDARPAHDRIRASIELLDMVTGSSALMDDETPETLDATSMDAAVQLGRLVSDEVQALSVGGLASIVDETDSVFASLVVIRGILRADREKSENTKRVICSTLVETTAGIERITDGVDGNMLTLAALASAYAAAIRSCICSDEMIATAHEVFCACVKAATLAARLELDHSGIVIEVTEFLQTYVLLATSQKPRMSTDAYAALLGRILGLLRAMPRGVGSGHLCRPNAPKEAMAIAASSFDPSGTSRRCALKVLEELVAGSTRDECSRMLEVALGGTGNRGGDLGRMALEHAELVLFMLENADNGVLRDLLNNQVDTVVFSLVASLAPANDPTDPTDSSEAALTAVTILRCLESIICRPSRFSKLQKRAIGTVLPAVQLMADAIADVPPGVERDACFDAVCHLTRGILRHQTSSIGRVLHLVSGIIAALQGALAMMFYRADGNDVRGQPVPEHLLEGLSRLLEEFAKVHAVVPYLQDALLTHIKLFMAPVARSSIDQCLSKRLHARVPPDCVGSVAVPSSATHVLSPGIAAVFGACGEDDIQHVFSSLASASKSESGEWRLRLEELKGTYEREFRYTGKV